MASFISSDQELLCSICAVCYKEPRKLPGCTHSFCETCILTLVQNLKKDENLGCEFECPICRLPSKSLEEDNVIVGWVQKLVKVTDLETKVAQQEEYDPGWCSQCKSMDTFVKSKVYCATCQDSFCETCSRTRHSFKMHKGHALIDLLEQTETIPIESTETVHEQAVKMLN